MNFILIKRQSLYFSKFLSLHLGFDIQLEPDFRHIFDKTKQFLHFRIMSNDGELSQEQKRLIAFWCLHAQPDWVSNWWHPHTVNPNKIEFDENGNFIINPIFLAEMIFALDPRRDLFLQLLQQKLSTEYSIPIQIISYANSIYLIGDNCDEKLSEKLQKTVRDAHVEVPFLTASGETLKISTLRVTPLLPSRLLSFKKDGDDTISTEPQPISINKFIELGLRGPFIEDCTFHFNCHKNQLYISQQSSVFKSPNVENYVEFSVTHLNLLLDSIKQFNIKYLPTVQDFKNFQSQVDKKLIHSKTSWYINDTNTIQVINNEITQLLSTPLFKNIDQVWFEYLKHQEGVEKKPLGRKVQKKIKAKI